MHFSTLSLAALLAVGASAVSAPTCYNHPGKLQRTGDYKFANLNLCEGECRSIGLPIAAAMGGNQCWCGEAMPPEENHVPQKSCDTPCNGWASENCTYTPTLLDMWKTSFTHMCRSAGGGDGFWSVWPIPAIPSPAPSSSSVSVSAMPSSSAFAA